MHGFLGRTIVAAAILMAAGCASRPLNAPPVEDWSGGVQGRGPTAPATVVVPQQLYTVRKEDSLNTIARRFDTTPADIATWNNLGPNPRVRVDQVLRVSPPAPPVAEGTPPVAVTQPVGNETIEQRPLGNPSDIPPVPAPTAPVLAPQPSTAPLKTGPLGAKRPYSEATLAELSRPDPDAPAGAGPPPAAPNAAPPAAAAGAPSWSWPATGKATSGFDGKSKGIDIPGKAGDPVLAAADGKVTFSGTGVRGYGNFVIIRHSPDLLSVYAHNRANLVKEGAVVTKGQKIAEMGNSDTDAVKLHFEIRNDSKPVDPLKYLPER